MKTPLLARVRPKPTPRLISNLRIEVQVEGRDQKMLLLLDPGQVHYRAHVAVVFQRRREPAKKLVVDNFARGVELHALMGSGAAERLFERKIRDDVEMS